MIDASLTRKITAGTIVIVNICGCMDFGFTRLARCKRSSYPSQPERSAMMSNKALIDGERGESARCLWGFEPGRQRQTPNGNQKETANATHL
jgi:hypothetical protein